MQRNNGIYKVLSLGWIYDWFQHLVGSKRAREWLVRNIWKCKVVDMGCGTGEVLTYLPSDIDYVGFDLSEEYVEQARKRYDRTACFLCGTGEDFINDTDSPLRDADLILCNGLLHHLDDEEAITLLQLAKSSLAPDGRFCCVEPTFLIHQGWWSRCVTKMDRGQNVRSEQAWRELFSQVFTSFSCNVATGLIRIPYCHIIVECKHDD
jgi:SAM-dependent methyltransferase